MSTSRFLVLALGLILAIVGAVMMGPLDIEGHLVAAAGVLIALWGFWPLQGELRAGRKLGPRERLVSLTVAATMMVALVVSFL